MDEREKRELAEKEVDGLTKRVKEVELEFNNKVIQKLNNIRNKNMKNCIRKTEDCMKTTSVLKQS